MAKQDPVVRLFKAFKELGVTQMQTLMALQREELKNYMGKATKMAKPPKNSARPLAEAVPPIAKEA